MVKAIKVMLIPNNVQKTKMFQYAGASRFAYNWALAREKENYEVNLSMAIQCYAQALFIGEKIELCDKVSYDLTPECFKGVDN